MKRWTCEKNMERFHSVVSGIEEGDNASYSEPGGRAMRARRMMISRSSSTTVRHAARGRTSSEKNHSKKKTLRLRPVAQGGVRQSTDTLGYRRAETRPPAHTAESV